MLLLLYNSAISIIENNIYNYIHRDIHKINRNLAGYIILVLNIACFIATPYFIYGNPGYYYKIINNNNYNKIDVLITSLNHSCYICCTNCKFYFNDIHKNNFIERIDCNYIQFDQIIVENEYYLPCSLDCGICSNITITFNYNNQIIFYNTHCASNDQICCNKFHINEYTIFYISKYNEVIEKLYICKFDCILSLILFPFSLLIIIIYIIYK